MIRRTWGKLRGPSRRAFLGGAAGAVTLPWLASLQSARGTPPEAPVRLLVWFSPNGFVPEHFVPPVGPLGDSLPRTLVPLTELRQELLLVSGFDNAPTIREIQGDHARGTGGTLTAAECLLMPDGSLQNGISIDQAIAAEIGHRTPFGSLELGAAPPSTFGTCDSGFPCAYTNHISWADASTPRPKIFEPQVLFDRLFAGSDAHQSEEEAERRRALRASVLDHVLDDAAALQPLLGADDRQRLDAYLTAVRELEQTLAPGPGGDGEVDLDLGYPERVQAMNDLMVLALEYDLTRIITFMAENGAAYHYHGHLGHSRAHHDLSHHNHDPEKLASLLQLEAWYVAQFAHLLQGLKAATDPVDGRPLLTNTAVLLTSEVSDGNEHLHTELPLLLAGQAGGQLTTGLHRAYPAGSRLGDFHLALAELMGVSLGTFGADGTRAVAL